MILYSRLKQRFIKLFKLIVLPAKFDAIINARNVVSIKKKIYLDSNSCKFQILYNPEPIYRKPIISNAYSHWKFEIGSPGLAHISEEVFIAQLQNVKVVGHSGAVLTNDNKIIKEVSIEIGRSIHNHSLLNRIIFKKPTYIKHTAAVVAAADANNNYFHWMLDVIPRIGWIIDSPYGLYGIKFWFINSRKHSFQNETLNHLGVDRQGTIELNYQSHYVCEDLVVPSLSGLSGNASSRVVKLLRNLFKAWMVKSENNSSEPIFISRNNSSKRRLLNFNELYPVLGELGIRVVELESMTVAEQAKLFYNSKLIIGIHGAGLTNLVFCEPNSTIVEIFSPNYVNQCYWTIASHVDMNYYYILGEGEVIEDRLNHLIDEDIVLNINTFKVLIEQIINKDINIIDGKV